MYLNLHEIQHISFDVWMTLLRSNPNFKPTRNQLIKSFFSLNNSIEEINDVMIYYDRLFTKMNEITGKQLDWQEVILLVINHLGKDISTISAPMFQTFYAEAEAIFWKYPPVLLYANLRETLSLAKQNRNISFNILSNTGFIEGRTLSAYFAQQGLESCFDFQLYSDEIQLSKPNPLVFEAVFAAAQKIKPLEKKQILHVGDNLVADGNGASDFGFSSFHTENCANFLAQLHLYACEVS